MPAKKIAGLIGSPPVVTKGGDGRTVSPKDNNISAAIKSYVDRVVHVMEEISASNADIKDIIDEAKGQGFDGPALRRAARIKAMDIEKRKKLEEREDVVNLYLGIVGINR